MIRLITTSIEGFCINLLLLLIVSIQIALLFTLMSLVFRLGGGLDD